MDYQRESHDHSSSPSSDRRVSAVTNPSTIGDNTPPERSLISKRVTITGPSLIRQQTAPPIAGARPQQQQPSISLSEANLASLEIARDRPEAFRIPYMDDGPIDLRPGETGIHRPIPIRPVVDAGAGFPSSRSVDMASAAIAGRPMKATGLCATLPRSAELKPVSQRSHEVASGLPTDISRPIEPKPSPARPPDVQLPPLARPVEPHPVPPRPIDPKLGSMRTTAVPPTSARPIDPQPSDILPAVHPRPSHPSGGTSPDSITVKPFATLNNDYHDLKTRYTTMESIYEADRQKTNVLLSKKDSHIARLQERLNSLEHRLETAVARSSIDANNHSLIAERDALSDKVQRLENAFAAEKHSWEMSLNDYREKLSSVERELRETKQLSTATTNISRRPSSIGNNKKPSFDNYNSASLDQISTTSTAANQQQQQQHQQRRGDCSSCSYFRHELERIEKTVQDLVRDKDQMQQETQRKETVLSELSTEATELRVQLNAFNEERTNYKRTIQRLEEENGRFKIKSSQHQQQPPAPVRSTPDEKSRLDENLLLRKKLDEAQDYFEAMDIESEQQITCLTNQLEDVHSTLEQRQRDITLLHNRLQELEHERDAAQSKNKTSEMNFARQQDVIEQLRDDTDRLRDKNREIVKDRDDLILRNAGVSHELDLVKREAQKQRDEIHAHLTEVSRELEQCKTKLQETVTADPNGVKLANLTRKVDDLEEALRERESTIRVQQQRLIDMKKALQTEWKLALENSPPPTITASMAYGLDTLDLGGLGLSNPYPGSPEERLLLHFQYLKNVILRFVTSTDYEATQLVRAVASLLCLSPDEERLVWDTLKWKMSWVPPSASKPKLPQAQ